MKLISKPADELTIYDFEKYPVWEFDTNKEGDKTRDETWVTPVTQLPVTTLSNRVVATKLRLHNGETKWAVLSNVSLDNPIRTKHFLFVTIYVNDKLFYLARYHDADYMYSGPAALAEFLGLRTYEVFPMRYDISDIATGDNAVLQGEIPEVVDEQLSERDIRILAVRGKLESF